METPFGCPQDHRVLSSSSGRNLAGSLQGFHAGGMKVVSLDLEHARRPWMERFQGWDAGMLREVVKNVGIYQQFV